MKTFSPLSFLRLMTLACVEWTQNQPSLHFKFNTRSDWLRDHILTYSVLISTRIASVFVLQRLEAQQSWRWMKVTLCFSALWSPLLGAPPLEDAGGSQAAGQPGLALAFLLFNGREVPLFLISSFFFLTFLAASPGLWRSQYQPLGTSLALLAPPTRFFR